MWGIFIRDTAYFIVIQWSSMTLRFIESQWNMLYPVCTGVRNFPIDSQRTQGSKLTFLPTRKMLQVPLRSTR